MAASKVFRGTLLVAAGVSVFCALAWGYQAGFRLNTSVSYPTGLYRLIDTRQTVIYGELVLFCPPNVAAVREAIKRGYLKPGRCPGGFQPVIKKVAAMPGTTVTLQKHVTLNGIEVPGATVRQSDGKGRPLPALADFVVPADEVFLLSDYAPETSFDSRYYGSVPQKNILGHMTPVWTYSVHSPK